MADKEGLTSSVRNYVRRMIADAGPGMKALLLDQATMGIVSAVLSQTEILSKEVYLVERLDAPAGEAMLHIKAVCFLRPVGENIAALRRHLRKPKFGGYHIFFSNILKESYLQELADADEGEHVKQVQEYFADYWALDHSLVSLELEDNALCFASSARDSQAAQRAYDRVVDGIGALLLALKKRPVIRFSQTSEAAQRIAQDVRRLAYEQEAALFDFRRADGPMLLLVLDRLDDPITPLLSQWTYQAMVHELLTMQNNRVDLHSFGSKVSKDNQEVVLSAEQDAFFQAQMYSNFGDLTQAIYRLVDDFQSTSRSNQKIQTIADMQRFVENYPEFKARSGNISKHVDLSQVLNLLVAERNLMNVSEVEQALVCGTFDRTVAFASITELLENPAVTHSNKIRLVLMFALRFERDGRQQLAQLLDAMGSDEETTALVNAFLTSACESKRTGDLFGNKNLFSRASKMVGSLKGVENVYTQHQPLLFDTIDNINKGKVKDADYPYAGPALGAKGRPQDILVFIVGGVTLEESRTVAQLNAANKGQRIILAGTNVLNSTAFLQDVAKMTHSA